MEAKHRLCAGHTKQLAKHASRTESSAISYTYLGGRFDTCASTSRKLIRHPVKSRMPLEPLTRLRMIDAGAKRQCVSNISATDWPPALSGLPLRYMLAQILRQGVPKRNLHKNGAEGDRHEGSPKPVTLVS